MSQNTSSAVMAQRVEAHDSLDYFPTPPWATRALCEWLKAEAAPINTLSCWEPACGAGDMARPLGEYFRQVRASDVARYGYGDQRDFLFPGEDVPSVDWIITNPPFRLAEQFITRATEGQYPLAKWGCAMLVRTAFLEGISRYASLFSKNMPFAVLQFSERVPIHKGKLTETGSTATAYCWVVWKYPYQANMTELRWIPPCRRKLEKPYDYADRAAA